MSRPPWPDCWNRAADWDAWYGDLDASERTRLLLADRSLPLIAAARQLGAQKIWFPGSGIAAGPAVWALGGFDVVGTDLSAVATGIQTRRWLQLKQGDPMDAGQPEAVLIRRLVSGWRGEGDMGDACFYQSDFCEEHPDGVEAIVNVDAFAGLLPDRLRAAAVTFWRALPPEGVGWFMTQGVPHEVQVELDDALLEAGFAVPLAPVRRFKSRLIQRHSDAVDIILGTVVPGPRPDERIALAPLQEELERLVQAEQRATIPAGTRVAWLVHQQD